METFEHKQAGDQIRIEKLGNPYLKGSEGLSSDSSNNLRFRLMQTVDDIPVPLDLELSAGDVVALAGDYYTKSGWGTQLQIPEKSGDCEEGNQQLLRLEVDSKEASAFQEAYDDLASPSVTQRAIDRIYAIERVFPSLLQQVAYALTVKDYGDKLSNNEAHFSPWSLRAYIVGHHSALQMAEMAFYCNQIAQGKVGKENPKIPAEIRTKLNKVLQQIQENPSRYKLQDVKGEQAILTELGHRYHALAIARDLFAMHFYSDHFAGGHLSRLGVMRQSLPQRFGMWGSILVNTMHNEDNKDSVTITNPFQPPQKPVGKDTFHMIREDCQAYGDGTYLSRGNDEDSNLLINGMDNSLGDITRLMITGEKRSSVDYGGLTFLPGIDYSKRQTQPLLIQGPDKKIYFCSDLQHIKVLSPTEYAETAKAPSKHGYEELTSWKAFLLVVKLRALTPFYSSKVESLTEARKQEIGKDEALHAQQATPENKKVLGHETVAEKSQEVAPKHPIGLWRKTPSATIPHTDAGKNSLFQRQHPLKDRDVEKAEARGQYTLAFLDKL